MVSSHVTRIIDLYPHACGNKSDKLSHDINNLWMITSLKIECQHKLAINLSNDVSPTTSVWCEDVNKSPESFAVRRIKRRNWKNLIRA